MQAAGVVLAGGRSSRMGAAKAGLDWHGSSLLRRVVGLVARGADGPVVVVRAPGQPLPALPADVLVLDDPALGRGPLQGIAVGLAAVAREAETAFVCSTDLPFLHPAYVRAVLALRTPDVDIVLPVLGGYRQPLAAAYATTVAERAARLVADGHPAPRPLLEQSRTLRVSELPEPGSVRNLNTRQAYEQALGEPQPLITVQRFGALVGRGRPVPQVRAATLGAVAEQVGLTLDRHLMAAVNGEQVTRDPMTPLVDEDEVAFLSADAGG